MGRGQSSKGHIHTAISRARITQLFIIKEFSVSSAKRKQLGLPERATLPAAARDPSKYQKKRGGIRNS